MDENVAQWTKICRSTVYLYPTTVAHTAGIPSTYDYELISLDYITLEIGMLVQIAQNDEVKLRLKAHPYVPNANLSNLNIFRTRTYQDWSRKIRMYGNVASIEGV